jgi:hypothetical protein
MGRQLSWWTDIPRRMVESGNLMANSFNQLIETIQNW